MLDKLIKTVDDQIRYFHMVLEKHPKESKTQAKIWALVSKHEAVLKFLQTQRDNPEQQRKPMYLPAQRQATIDIENTIFKIIDACEGLASVAHIRASLPLHGYENINTPRLDNHLFTMHRRKCVIKQVGKGFYVINSELSVPD